MSTCPKCGAQIKALFGGIVMIHNVIHCGGLKMPKSTNPWDEGRTAYFDGESFSECPYSDEDPDRIEWEGGWMSAEEQDEEPAE